MIQYLKKCIVIIFFVFILAGGSSESAGKEVLTNDPKQSNSLLSDTQILNIAHRGASGCSPEHTIVLYEAGTNVADYIEMTYR